MECLISQEREILKEEMELRDISREGQPPLPRPGRDEVTIAPKCTSEGAGYAIECWPCRLGGKKAVYIGETSRSPYQCGKEHHK